MKKLLLICSGILCVTAILLSVLDNGEYVLERNLWKAKKNFQAIAKDPQAAPPAKYTALVDEYQRMIDRHPKSRYLPLLYKQKGNVFLMQKDFSEARSVFQEALERFPDNEKVQIEMLLAVGASYEKEGDVNQALSVYKTLQNKFPNTDLDITMPLFIADFYLRIGEVEKHRAALNDAVSYFLSAMDKEEDEGRKLKLMRSLAAVYLAQEEWRKAVDILKRALFTSADNPKADPRQALILGNAIARISVIQLRDPNVALGIVQAFLAKYPQHPGEKFFKTMITGLQGEDVQAFLESQEPLQE